MARTLPGALLVLVVAAFAGRGPAALAGAAALSALYLTVHAVSPRAMERRRRQARGRARRDDRGVRRRRVAAGRSGRADVHRGSGSGRCRAGIPTVPRTVHVAASAAAVALVLASRGARAAGSLVLGAHLESAVTLITANTSPGGFACHSRTGTRPHSSIRRRPQFPIFRVEATRRTGLLILWFSQTRVVTGTAEQCEAALTSAQRHNRRPGLVELPARSCS